MNLSQGHHKSLAGINKLPADLWWTWLKFITNHWLGLTSCQLICDEPSWSSSQITGWDWKVASWFTMNLSQVHRKSFDLFWDRFCDEKVANWFVMKSYLLNLDFKDILESKTHTRTSLFTSHCVSSESSSWGKSCQLIWVESPFGLLQITLFWLRVGFVNKFWDKTANILEIPNLKLFQHPNIILLVVTWHCWETMLMFFTLF